MRVQAVVIMHIYMQVDNHFIWKGGQEVYSCETTFIASNCIDIMLSLCL